MATTRVKTPLLHRLLRHACARNDVLPSCVAVRAPRAIGPRRAVPRRCRWGGSRARRVDPGAVCRADLRRAARPHDDGGLPSPRLGAARRRARDAEEASRGAFRRLARDRHEAPAPPADAACGWPSIAPRRLPRGPRASCAPARARRAACRGPRSFARSVGRTACLSAGFRANLPPRHTTDKHAATRRARAIRRPYCRSSRKREEEIWSRRGIARFMLKIRSIVAC
ncbi:hypothetical protein X978_4331 [Burkholderia pseudomallei MSHR3965]|nr:hypothetical protein X978_4331 [Burkholderia pseudomallei MSHR3965]KGT02113.1 hypothetical protein JT30_4314 [Burkholderia pseudomallei]KGW03005.1 hypothetical protein X980_3277 [Burkholderia pseudomallei MSHR4000]